MPALTIAHYVSRRVRDAGLTVVQRLPHVLFMQANRGSGTRRPSQIENLYEDRECEGEVDVASRDMMTDTVGDQSHTRFVCAPKVVTKTSAKTASDFFNIGSIRR